MKIKKDHWTWSATPEVAITYAHEPEIVEALMSCPEYQQTMLAEHVESGIFPLRMFIKLNKARAAGAACMYCGKALTHHKSIERGYGPICGRENGEFDEDEVELTECQTCGAKEMVMYLTDCEECNEAFRHEMEYRGRHGL